MTFSWTATPIGWVLLAIFVVAYALVVFEERLGLRKSKPVLFAAGLMWALVAFQALRTGTEQEQVRTLFREGFTHFAELFFFLIVAMSYVAAIGERNVFEAMRAELVSRRLSYRALFWWTGVLAFFLSAVLDNLTTALVMAGVVLAVARDNPRFVALACVNLVVAANAGGAWCAFGDITTLMVWQAHRAEFFDFFRLFVPSVVNFLVPALIMHWFVPKGAPSPGVDDADIKPGGLGVCALFATTIVITVAAKQLLGMPPVFGMMFGLGLLNLYAAWIGRMERRRAVEPVIPGGGYNIFRIIAQAEWDTLLFFYGVLMCVGALATAGYMALWAGWLYGTLGNTGANVALGVASAIVDNIPIMYAVLRMNPPMDLSQWLLITLTTGVGGSLLAIGSAAGVALMGVSRGHYTFMSHLRWTWAIALGYGASVLTHLWLVERAG